MEMPKQFGSLLVSVSALPLLMFTAGPAGAQQTDPAAQQNPPAPQQAQPPAPEQAAENTSDQAGAVNVPSTGDDAIVVIGRRASIEAAADLERKSNVLKSVVTADDIGQFGDPTVAESLQRISGVSINRQNGEGQQVSIRGLPSEFATVTVDGARLGATDPEISSTRMDFVSSDNLSQIEVTKALTPEQDGDAIAGSVNLITNSAFRRGKDSVGARAEINYEDRRDSWNPKLSGDFTKIIDLADGNRIGLAGSVTWSKTDTFTDDARVDDGLEWVVNNRTEANPRHQVAADCAAANVLACYLRPQQWDHRAEYRDIKRLSIGGAVEFELGNTLLEFRGTKSSEDSDRYNNRQTFITERSEDTNSVKEVLAIAPDSEDLIDARSERRMRPGTIENDVYTLGFEGRTDWGGWVLTYGGNYASNREQIDELEGRFRVDDIRLTYTGMDRHGVDEVSLSQQASNRPNPLDPSRWTLVSNRVNNRVTDSKDKNWSIHSDLEHKFMAFDEDAAIKVGAKYRERSRDFNFDRFEIDVGPGVHLGQFENLADQVKESDLLIMFDPDRNELEDRLKELVANGTVLTGGTGLENSPIIESLRGDYDGKEKVFSGYTQFTVHPAHNVQVIGGLRVESTDFHSTGSRVRDLVYDTVATDLLAVEMAQGGVSAANIAAYRATRTANVPVEPFEGGNDYTEWLPSLNIKWEPTDDIVVRASYSKGIKRPEFREAAAIQTFVTTEFLEETTLQQVINTNFGGVLTSAAQANAAIAQAVAIDGDPQFVTEGTELRDPTLDPLTAHNFDASVAWYPSRNTTLSISAFYKKIKNFIFPVGIAGDDVQQFGYPPDDGTATSVGVDRFNTFMNGNKAKVYGVEIAAYQAFRFLPKPLDGFYVEGNMTIANSEASAPIVDRTFSFPDQSDFIGNLSVGYENKLFSLRGALVYQGPRLRALNFGQLRDANDDTGDLLEDKRTQIDISARVNVTEQIQVYFDAINITEAGDRRYFRGFENVEIFARNEQYGASYQGGVRVRF